MSDADDQMGGQGGETGRAPGDAPEERGKGGQDPAESEKPDEDAERLERVDRYGEDSFPASDPPGAP